LHLQLLQQSTVLPLALLRLRLIRHADEADERGG
jgi:hypothetical protein